MNSQSPLIEVTDLRKSYGELEVIKGVSFSAKSQEVLSLIGSSGSGKSTILRCMNLLEIPSAGSVVIAGARMPLVETRSGLKVSDEEALRRIRTNLGMVFQSFNLWSHLTILENVMEGPVHVLGEPKKFARDKSMSLLERVGIVDKINAYPRQLSGGQQQRAAIARTLAMGPKILLFDEPTSALDPEMVGEVLEVMRELAADGHSMIVVTHEMNFAREVSNQVIFLENGLIGEQGPPDALFGNPQSAGCQAFLEKVI